MSTNYGYIRVSSYDQNEDRQVIVMQKMQIPSKNLYTDKQSGKILTARSIKNYCVN